MHSMQMHWIARAAPVELMATGNSNTTLTGFYMAMLTRFLE